MEQPCGTAPARPHRAGVEVGLTMLVNGIATPGSGSQDHNNGLKHQYPLGKGRSDGDLLPSTLDLSMPRAQATPKLGHREGI